MDWPHAELIVTERLSLEPLRMEHADSMVAVLAGASLYEFTGGVAPTLDRLRSRFAAQSVGHSADGSQGWLNWVVRLAATDDPLGFVQATVTLDWLRSKGVSHFVAHIHPDHQASMGVARKLGLSPSLAEKDGEVRWES